MTRYSTRDVSVPGGSLRVGVWEASHSGANDSSSVPTVLAIHGVTASHRSWSLLADALPDVRVVAPDLRGRGRSNQIVGPFGMAAHADDMAAALHHIGVDNVVVVGHSMGGFVALVTADRHPEAVRALVLIDGGIPLPAPDEADAGSQVAATLNLAEQRLRMTFPDRDSYRAFWAQHPAFSADWTEALEDYIDYDLQGVEPELRPGTNFDAVVADSRDIADGTTLLGSLGRLDRPADLLLAPQGMAPENPPLYPDYYVATWQERLPAMRAERVKDVNHYTIVMSRRGSAAVASAIRSAFT